MATLRKRNNRWQVQVRRSGAGAASKTFNKKVDALAWARERESLLERGESFENHQVLKKMTLADLIERYVIEILPNKKAVVQEKSAIGLILPERFSSVPLDKLTRSDFAKYAERRLSVVKTDTFLRQYGVLRHLLNTARNKWGIPINKNILSSVSLPQPQKGRNRRLVQNEENRILQAVGDCLNPHMKPIILFALETAMRQGEIITIRLENINFDRSTLVIPETKNGRPRTIPLYQKAFGILLEKAELESGLVFPISASAIKQSWRRLVIRAEIPDLRFHDLRHEYMLCLN